jgi:menaquinone-specific isochorismate synthase
LNTSVEAIRQLSERVSLRYFLTESKSSQVSIPEGAQVFARGENLMIGIGEKARFEAFGENRFLELAEKFNQFSQEVEIIGEIDSSAGSINAFAAITFSPESDHGSVLIVPESMLIIRNEKTWVASFIENFQWPATSQPNPQTLNFSQGDQSQAGFMESIAQALSRIDDGEISKVVLARDLVSKKPKGFDIRDGIQRLRKRFPSCWVYSINDNFGASPELLLRSANREFSARVLAGTAGRGTDPDVDSAIADGLSHSAKNLHEHNFAVDSMIRAITPFVDSVEADKTPFSLKLPDVWHLATDIHAKLNSDSTILEVASALHPTAAVAGTPRLQAQNLINKLEPFDRGVYSGPVGWVGSNGSGELALALRGGRIEKDKIRAFAGCGIVSGSEPEAELSETKLKFKAVRSAFD